MNWSPAALAAAERCGVRTDDVVARSYEVKTHKLTVLHRDGGASVFHITDEDRPPPCPTCGRP